MNRRGGVCPGYRRVCQRACLNSVKTFGREDEDSRGRMVTALSSITPTHSSPGPCYQGLLLRQAFLLGTQVNNQPFAKNKCPPKFAHTNMQRRAAISVT